MGTVDLPFLNSFRDRYGVMRYYYRRDGKNIPLRAEKVAHDYVKVHDEFENEGQVTMTFADLVDAYFKSSEFVQLKPSTQWQYQWHLKQAVEKLGQLPLTELTRAKVLEHRDSIMKTPVKANSRVRVLKTVLSYAVQRELLENNPLLGVRSLKVESEGWTPWPPEALEVFKEKSTGSARMAFFLALFTGQRRGDVLVMKWADVRGGFIRVKQQKTGAALEIPVHPQLQAELVKHGVDKPPGQTLVSRRDGGAYSPDGFARIWEDAQKRLGVYGNPFHGLRKNAIQMLFEAGCTPQEVMAVSGHTTLELVAHYGKKSNQKSLAQAAMDKLLTRQAKKED